MTERLGLGPTADEDEDEDEESGSRGANSTMPESEHSADAGKIVRAEEAVGETRTKEETNLESRHPGAQAKLKSAPEAKRGQVKSKISEVAGVLAFGPVFYYSGRYLLRERAKRHEANTNQAKAKEKARIAEMIPPEKVRLASFEQISTELKNRETAQQEAQYGPGVFGKFRERVSSSGGWKAVKIIGKVLLGTGAITLSHASLLTGPFAPIIAPFLYLQGIRLTSDGLIEGGQELLNLKKNRSLRGEMEQARQEMSGAVQDLCDLEKKRGEYSKEEYEKQAEEIIKAIAVKERVAASRQNEIFQNEKAQREFRHKWSKRISIALSLFTGVAMGGPLNLDQNPEKHRVIWSLLKKSTGPHGGWKFSQFNFIYNQNNIPAPTTTQFAPYLKHLIGASGTGHTVGSQILSGYIGLGAALGSMFLRVGTPAGARYTAPSFVMNGNGAAPGNEIAATPKEMPPKSPVTPSPAPPAAPAPRPEPGPAREKTSEELYAEYSEKIGKLRQESKRGDERTAVLEGEITELKKQPETAETKAAIAAKKEEQARLAARKNEIKQELGKISAIEVIVDKLRYCDRDIKRDAEELRNLAGKPESGVVKSQRKTLQDKIEANNTKRTELLGQLAGAVQRSGDPKAPETIPKAEALDPSSLDSLTEFSKKTELETKESYEKSLDRAIEALKGTEGIVELKKGVPTVIIPDLHARREMLTGILSQTTNSGEKIFDLLKQGKINVVCLGDGMHSESPDKASRWSQASGYCACGNFSEALKIIDTEMVDSFGMMKMIMELKASFPDTFHYIKGNHDEIGGGFLKWAISKSADGKTAYGESYLVRLWVKERLDGGADNGPFYQKYAHFEASLPLLVKGKGFVASHAAPGSVLEHENIKKRDKDAARKLTWTENTSGETDETKIEGTLRNIGAEGSQWIIGHREAGDHDGRYRDQFNNGKLIQMNNPHNPVYATVAADGAFNPDHNIKKL